MSKEIGFSTKNKASRRGFLRKNILYVRYIIIELFENIYYKISNLNYIINCIKINCIKQNIFYSI